MEKYIKNHSEWIDSTWEKLDKKLSRIAIKSRDKIPYTTVNGEHDNRIGCINAWTNGFFGGLMWIMYLGTKNEEYKITAERQEDFLDKALSDYEKLHHDVGFMWDITSGVNYRVTGNEKSKNRWATAASLLASRYNIDGGFIRAWNGKGTEGYTIIDCMMNIPMLYRANELNGDDRFKSIAMRHADMTMNHHIREDGSVYHIVDHNPKTGEVVDCLAGQGYAKESSWSRGQSWAVYGFAMSYIFTKEKKYLDIAKKVAHYFITNLADNDYLPLVDFRSPDEPVFYDSTASAAAACGLIEIARCVPEHEKKIYINAAIKMLKALEENYCDWTDSEDSILQMGTDEYNGETHVPIIYGDFFFAEAILKLKGNDFLMW